MNQTLRTLFQKALDAGWTPPQEWANIFKEELEGLA